MSHPEVPHPDTLLTREKQFIVKLNDKAAFRLAAFYGAAITIWLFALYSLMGAVFAKEQPTMLYWSNAAQLVFCPLMVYVGNKLGASQQAKADADHQALTHIATTGDSILAALRKDGDG